jgi:AcrR family transcriptional regulator
MQVTPLSSAAEGDAASAHESRLIGAMAVLLAKKKYAAVTIADIAREARVSKRTFYEHFATKETCFIACYEAMSAFALASIAEATSRCVSWVEQTHAATKAYLSTLEAQPALTRTLMMDIYSAGPEALRARRAVQRRFADYLRKVVDQRRKDNPKLRRLSPAMATAIIGGINELVLVAVEEGREDRLTELSGTADELLEAVLSRPFRRDR